MPSHLGRAEHGRALATNRWQRRQAGVQYLPDTISAPEHAVAGSRGLLGNGRSRQPLVDDGVLLQLSAKVVPDLLPAHHLTPIRLRNRLHPVSTKQYKEGLLACTDLSSVHKVLVALVSGQPLLLQPGSNAGGRCPAVGVDLIAT